MMQVELKYYQSTSYLKKLNFYLKASLEGLENLRKTYNYDIVTNSKLEIIINNIDSYLLKIDKKIENIEKMNNINKEKKL